MKNLLTAMSLSVALNLLMGLSLNAQTKSGHITLTNGDRIPTKLDSYAKDRLTFGSPIFLESATVNKKFVKSFGFLPGSAANEESSDSFQFQFRGGDQINGRLIALNESDCVLQHAAIGKVTIPTSKLQLIKRLTNNSQDIAYTALNWQQLAGKLESVLKADNTGHFVLSNILGNQIQPAFRFESEGTLTLDYVVDDKMGFNVSLLNSKSQIIATVGVAPGAVVLEAGNEIEFGDAPTAGPSQRLSFGYDGQSLVVQGALGQSLAKISLGNPGPLSVQIKNSGSKLLINSLVMSGKFQPARNASSDVMNVLLAGKQWDPATAFRVEENRLTYQTKDDSEQAVELSELEQIWLGSQAASTENNSDSDCYCLWPGEQRIAVSDVQFQEQKLTFSTAEFECEGEISQSLPQEIFFTRARSSTNRRQSRQRGQSEFQLAISGIPFDGTYRWGDASEPMQWQFFGFEKPVTLNIQRKIEISRRGAGARSASPASPDHVVLKDGTIVPCAIQSGDETTLNIESSHVDSKSIPGDALRSCFFNSKRMSWTKGLTQETINRALTAPRFSRDILFNHVLIGRNGDLIRGTLVKIGAETITFESRFDPIEIPRENVAAIISVDDVAEETATPQPGNANQQQGKLQAHIRCAGNFTAVGDYVALDNEKAIVQTSYLGRLQVDGEQIQQMAFNMPFREADSFEAFSDWKINGSIEPRWVEEEEVSEKANELMNQPATDFELPLLADTRGFRLADHAGKIVVLNFWETTSTPSVLGIPEYRNVIQSFSPKDVVFIAPNQGETQSTIEKFLKSKGWSSLDIGMDFNREISQQFRVTAIPHLTVLDREGIIRFIDIGYSTNSAAELKAEIQRLLEQ